MNTLSTSTAAETSAALLLAHCTVCDGWSFPAHVPGCRHCGATPTQLLTKASPTTPRLLNFITVHAPLAPDLKVPAVIGAVALAPGLTEEVCINVSDEESLSLGMALRPHWQPPDEKSTGRWVFSPLDSLGGAGESAASTHSTQARVEGLPARASTSTTSSLLRERPVYVVGIGQHPYAFPSETPYIQLGLHAVREALRDAGMEWRQVESAVVGTAALGMATGRVMLRHLGSTGLEVMQVENASASGSTAFRTACLQVASGERDVVLAMGVDKFGDGRRAVLKDGLPPLSPTANVPLVKFALLVRRCMREQGLTLEDMARVAVKNHGNASRNPYAQFRKPRSLEQVLTSAPVAGDLTALQCCPRGEGAAAVIVVSEDALRRLHLPRERAVRVLSSVASSETLPADDTPALVELVRESSAAALAEAGVGARELDIVELHDAFTIEELLYTEATGVCGIGEGAAYIASGDADIGGRCAINPSGGLIGMGHPLGPTGIGQVAEITRQLRGEAEGRQQPKARLALAHMIGLGSVAVAHVLARA